MANNNDKDYPKPITNEQLAAMLSNLGEQVQEMNDKMEHIISEVGNTTQVVFLKLDRIRMEMEKKQGGYRKV